MAEGQPEQFKIYHAVYGVLQQEGKVFAVRRANTGFADGRLTFPAGHVEAGETPIHALVREMQEETGVTVAEKDVEFFHVQHFCAHALGDRTYVNYYFKIRRWQGRPHNAEPAKASEAIWIDETRPPVDFLKYQLPVIAALSSAEPYSQFIRQKGDTL